MDQDERERPESGESDARPAGDLESRRRDHPADGDHADTRGKDDKRPATANRYPQEVRDRAVGLVMNHRDEYKNETAAIRAIADEIGCSPETLRNWVRQAEQTPGEPWALTSTRREASSQAAVEPTADNPLPPPSIVIVHDGASRDREPADAPTEPPAEKPDRSPWTWVLLAALLVCLIGLAYFAGSTIGGQLL